MSRFVLAAIAGLSLTACGTRPVPVVMAPPPPIEVAVAPPPPPVSPINRGLSGAATVWHLRVALNVAALACRGPNEATIIARYNALLAGQKATLATAEATLAAEFRATGGAEWRDRYDDAMTRLYNFFSQAQARDAFCAAAGQVLEETPGVTPATLGDFAATRLPLLDAPFAAMLAPRALPVPVIALVASVPVPATPAYVAPAPRPAPAPAVAQRPAPRLELDLSDLE